MRAHVYPVCAFVCLLQCLRVGETNEAFQAELDRKDGCNVQGYVEVQKVNDPV